MPIHAYGLFWRRDAVNWKPGAGNANQFRLLGRRGKVGAGVRLADFRKQQGIYVLYSQHGPYYVGLVSKNELGYRLRTHTTDLHARHWDRSSWFGFCDVRERIGADLIHPVKPLRPVREDDPAGPIKDAEAMLIHALGTPGNKRVMSFMNEEKWEVCTLALIAVANSLGLEPPREPTLDLRVRYRALPGSRSIGDSHLVLECDCGERLVCSSC